jgi:hypothetical protein
MDFCCLKLTLFIEELKGLVHFLMTYRLQKVGLQLKTKVFQQIFYNYEKELLKYAKLMILI